MYLLPIYLTLFNFIVNILFGKWIGIRGVCFVTTFFIFISFLSSLFIFYEVVINESLCYVSVVNWFNFDIVNVTWSFYFDPLTSFMLLVVLLVSFCAHLYSTEYMSGDPHQARFMSYLSLFTFFMLVLITAGNLIQLFVGWEGVGICSYLLINFWYTRLKANKAAMMAVIVNKLGDICLMIAFGYVYYIYKSFDFTVIYSYVQVFFVYDSEWFCFLKPFMLDINYFICLLFILGAVGKSAQIGLHMWLPEAMEGPTPVSSLIHAATMVTAGIFLILRSSFLFENTPSVLLWVVFFGSITIFIASSIGVFQNDLKKIVAYSTCSQLGYMFLSCGLSGYTYSLFHLFNHAFFKALLFLTAGYIIHAISNEQDIRKMGGLVKLFPFAYIMILVASLSLMGFPFLSGFYSKEKIIDLFLSKYSLSMLDLSNSNLYFFFHLFSLMGIICTVTYSVKLLLIVFFNYFSGFYGYISANVYSFSHYFKYSFRFINNINKLHYGSFVLIFPLLLLFILSVISGFVFKDVMIGNNLFLWKNSLSIPSFNNELISNNFFFLFDYEFNDYMRAVTFYWVIYFSLLNIFIFSMSSNILNLYRIVISSLYTNFLHKFFVEKYIFFNKLIIDCSSYALFYLSYSITYLLFDKGVIERFTSFGLFTNIHNLVIRIRTTEAKYTTNYLLFFFIGYFILYYIVL